MERPLPAASTPDAQLAFLAELTDRLRADPRVLAAWVIGSLARDTADAHSDVDLLLVVEPRDLPAIVADPAPFVAALSPTILLQRIGPDSKPTLVAIAPGWQRFDLTLCAADDPTPHGYTAARLLFDRADHAARARFLPAAAPDPARLLPPLIRDFIRSLGLTPIVLGRGELLIARQGHAIMQNLLIDLLLLESGGRRGGGKRLNHDLAPDARALLEALPAPALTPDALLDAHLTVARAFLLRARRLAAAHAVPYPDEFERETLDYLRRELGATL